jgi:hypothetical protein
MLKKSLTDVVDLHRINAIGIAPTNWQTYFLCIDDESGRFAACRINKTRINLWQCLSAGV